MRSPDQVLHSKRIQAINAVIRKIEHARADGIYTLHFAQALEHMRLALLETQVDYDRRFEAWKEESAREAQQKG